MEGEAVLTALGEKLRELRERKRLGLRAAARALGISHTRLSAYERGEMSGRPAIPRRAVLQRIAVLYDFPSEALLGLAGLPVEEAAPHASPGEVDTQAQELAHILYRLTDHERRILLGTARLLLAEHAEGEVYGPRNQEEGQ